MRALLVLGLLTAACLAACVDDVPSYEVPASQVIEQAAQPVESRELPEAELEPEPSSQPAPQSEADPVVIFRLIDDLNIYPWPGELWQPFVRHRPNTLLLADGRARSGNGDLWLRLDMNNDVVGWVRQHETPLSATEVESLPWVPAGALPTAEFDVPGGGTVTVTLLGRSTDAQRLVMLLPGSEEPLLVYRSDLDLGRDVNWLPVYEGPVFGEWRPPQEPPIVAVEAKGEAAIHVQPNGEPSGFRIYRVGDAWSSEPPIQYAVLGRSLDEQWLAIRMDDLVPPVGWVQLDSVELNVDPTTLPYMLSGQTALFPVAKIDEGMERHSVLSAERLYYWRWRDDSVLVGSNDGLRRWDPAVEAEPIQFAPPQWPVFSPDGRFVASGTSPNYESGDRKRDITITEVDSGDSITFPDGGAARFTHHDSDPSLHWSPDSRLLVAWYHSFDEDDWTGVNVLSLDGGVTRFDASLTGDFVRWLPDGTLLMRRDETHLVYSADGALIRELPGLSSPYGRFDHMRSLRWDTAERGWIIFDLATNERRALPPPLDSSDWRSNQSWSPIQHTQGHLTLFTRAGAADVVSSLVYDADRHLVIDLPDVAVATTGFDWIVQGRLWSDDGRRVAVTFRDGQGYIYDVAAGTATTLPLPERCIEEPCGSQWDDLVDWSPDGRLLLTKSTRRSGAYDEDGVAAFPSRPGYVSPPWPAITEYRLIDAANGQLVARFRANTDECWGAGHTAAFSPDGQWLAFSGRVNDCT